MGNCAAGKNKN